jgi:hypothetical protein
MFSTAVLSAGSRAARPSSMSTGAGASTGTAARGGGSKGERVPRTGWRFVRHLNRLSALAFLRPVRKVSLGAEFPTPFREPILRPGLPTPLPRAGRVENTERAERRLGIPIRGGRKEREFSFLAFGRAEKCLCPPGQAAAGADAEAARLRAPPPTGANAKVAGGQAARPGNDPGTGSPRAGRHQPHTSQLASRARLPPRAQAPQTRRKQCLGEASRPPLQSSSQRTHASRRSRDVVIWRNCDTLPQLDKRCATSVGDERHRCGHRGPRCAWCRPSDAKRKAAGGDEKY